MQEKNLRGIWEECLQQFKTYVLNASLLDFAWAKLLSYLERDPISGVARFSYIIAAYHPLVDANKRCAACFLLSALKYMGKSLKLSQYDLLQIFLSAAAGELKEEEFVRIIKVYVD